MPNSAAPPSYGAPPAYAPSGESAPVRRDLSGNVIPNAASATPPPANPYAYAPSPQVTPQPGTWPPPPSGNAATTPYGMPPPKNTSGSQSDVPLEVARLKWNWGAFGFPWLWCYYHGLRGVTITVLVAYFVLNFFHGVSPRGQVQVTSFAYDFLYLALMVYLGFNGNKIAWRNRNFPGGVAEFFQVQRAWLTAGIIYFTIVVSGFVWILWYIQATPQLSAPAGNTYSQSNSGTGGQ
jgi:hypothetical protein